MIRGALFGLVAMLPAALGTGPVAARAIAAPLCTGTGELRVMTIPIKGTAPLPGDGSAPCCAKGCHGGASRKRAISSARTRTI